MLTTDEHREGRKEEKRVGQLISLIYANFLLQSTLQVLIES